MNLSMSHSTSKRNHVRVHNRDRDDDYAVQVFFGNDSNFSLYMNVEEARQFALDLLAALPTSIPQDVV